MALFECLAYQLHNNNVGLMGHLPLNVITIEVEFTMGGMVPVVGTYIKFGMCWLACIL